MAYTGEVLDQCGVLNIDLSRVEVVVVSGDGPNVCGHMLLRGGSSSGGTYYHVSEFRDQPRYMSETGYRRYLRESGKRELRRIALTLPDPRAAEAYLEDLLANTWQWGVLPNNCVAFVEEVIHAGGGTWGSYSNCPDLATQDTISTRIQRFLGQLENEIYGLYGVPR